MKIRMHRATIDEAMETLAEIEPTLEAIRGYVHPHGFPVNPASAMIVYRYDDGAGDPRIGWPEVYVVCEITPDGKTWPCAWTNEMPI
jgi:hypothetical protein